MSGFDQIDVARFRKVTGLFDSPVGAEAFAAFGKARSMAERCGVSLVDAPDSRARQPGIVDITGSVLVAGTCAAYIAMDA